MPTPSESYRLIPLTQGQFAKVSPHRFAELNQHKWSARWDPRGKCFYASYRTPEGYTHMHRMILGLSPDDLRQGDHENHDTLDNTDRNLRIATGTQNQGNRRLSKNSTSGFKGVSWCWRSNKWRAYLKRQGKQIHLGHFDTPKDAHAAYCAAAKEYFGEFSRAG